MTPILLYHQITDDPDPDDPFRLAVTPARFERQMTDLAQRGYRCVSLAEAFAKRRSGERALKTVAITFDDGYADNYEAAFPVLRRLGFTATIFVVSGFIGRTPRWPHNTRHAFLTWDQLRDMAENGIAFGAHTVTHPNLPEIDREAAAEEIAQSRRVLAEGLNRPIRFFAYPGGHQTPDLQQLVQDAGFDGACGVDIGPDTPFNTWRVQINSDDSLALFRLKTSGYFEQLKRVRQRSRLAHWATQTAGHLLNRIRL